MGMMSNRRRMMGGKSHKEPININVKTHSIGSFDASLDVITGDGEPVNILYTTVTQTPWTNGYIQVTYKVNVGWKLFAMTSCLYNEQVYKSGDLIANWIFNVRKNINIVANI